MQLTLRLCTALAGYRKLNEYSSAAASAGGCSRHALLYGQIHHDLMPWATKGISQSNIAATRELVERPQGNYISILVENGQVGAHAAAVLPGVWLPWWPASCAIRLAPHAMADSGSMQALGTTAHRRT
jgi:hypothetical protein